MCWATVLGFWGVGGRSPQAPERSEDVPMRGNWDDEAGGTK